MAPVLMLYILMYHIYISDVERGVSGRVMSLMEHKEYCIRPSLYMSQVYGPRHIVYHMKPVTCDVPVFAYLIWEVVDAKGLNFIDMCICSELPVMANPKCHNSHMRFDPW